MTDDRSLMDEIDENVNVPASKKRLMQRKMGFLQQVNETLAEKHMTEQELLEFVETDKSNVAELFSADYDLSLKEIAQLESALDEDLFKVKRNIGLKDNS